jgi:hypothetical protein
MNSDCKKYKHMIMKIKSPSIKRTPYLLAYLLAPATAPLTLALYSLYDGIFIDPLKGGTSIHFMIEFTSVFLVIGGIISYGSMILGALSIQVLRKTNSFHGVGVLLMFATIGMCVMLIIFDNDHVLGRALMGAVFGAINAVIFIILAKLPWRNRSNVK